MDPLVSVPWLAARLGDAKVVVLDASLPLIGVQPAVDVHARYLQRHIAGAVFFDIEALSEKATALPHMLPSTQKFAEDMGALGISDDMTLIVYEQDGVFSAPRAWWMLRTMGARDVRVLQGGLRAWVEAGHNTEAGRVTRPTAVFRAALQQDAVRTLDVMRRLAQDGTTEEQVLDARSAGRFAGSAPEPRAGWRSGHMPGSINVPYTELVQNGRLKEPEQILAVLEAHGVDLAKPITTSCGSGITAAVLALGLERCGATRVRLFDGSWTEYAAEPDAFIATS